MRIIELTSLEPQAAAAMVNFVCSVFRMPGTRLFAFQIGRHFMKIRQIAPPSWYINPKFEPLVFGQGFTRVATGLKIGPCHRSPNFGNVVTYQTRPLKASILVFTNMT